MPVEPISGTGTDFFSTTEVPTAAIPPGPEPTTGPTTAIPATIGPTLEPATGGPTADLPETGGQHRPFQLPVDQHRLFQLLVDQQPLLQAVWLARLLQRRLKLEQQQAQPLYPLPMKRHQVLSLVTEAGTTSAPSPTGETTTITPTGPSPTTPPAPQEGIAIPASCFSFNYEIGNGQVPNEEQFAAAAAVTEANIESVFEEALPIIRSQVQGVTVTGEGTTAPQHLQLLNTTSKLLSVTIRKSSPIRLPSMGSSRMLTAVAGSQQLVNELQTELPADNPSARQLQ